MRYNSVWTTDESYFFWKTNIYEFFEIMPQSSTFIIKTPLDRIDNITRDGNKFEQEKVRYYSA